MKRDLTLVGGTIQVTLENNGGTGTYLAFRWFTPSDIGTDWAYYEVPTANAVGIGGNITAVCGISDAGTALSAGGGLYIDEVAPIPDDAGDLRSTGWASVGSSPEDFDIGRSPFQVSPGDGQALMCCFELSGNLYGAKEHSLWATSENGGDPTTWLWQKISDVAGSSSVNGVGYANKFVILACRSGVYYFDGGQPQKISQDLELGTDPTLTTWRSIDWTQGHKIWVSVDPEKMQFRIGIPTDPGTQGCTKTLVGDYTEGFGSASIIAGGSMPTAAGGRGLKWSIDTIVATCGEQSERDNKSSSAFIGGALVSSNHVLNSSNFAFPSPWTTAGTNPTVTAGQVDAVAGTGASRLQFIAGTNRITLNDAYYPALGEFYTASIRLKLNSGGASLAAILKSPGAAFGTDFPILITTAWQRFTVTWGPMDGTTPEQLIIDFGAAASDILISSAQIQAGQYDFGECATTGSACAGIESGFVARPVLGQTQDFFQAIPSIYETAPFAAPIGRSTFGKLILRIRGSGTLVTQWVRPDGTLGNLRGGQYPTLIPSPLYDTELDSNEQASQLGVRISNSARTGWWLMQKIGALIKPAEYAQYRGRG